jgi:hypothetical protein
METNTLRYTMKLKYGYSGPNTNEGAMYLDTLNSNT